MGTYLPTCLACKHEKDIRIGHREYIPMANFHVGVCARGCGGLFPGAFFSAFILYYNMLKYVQLGTHIVKIIIFAEPSFIFGF